MKKYNLVIGSDHGGYNLKKILLEFLQSLGHTVDDYGTHSTESCDYPDYAFKVAKSVSDGSHDKGILVCTTGQGVAMAANKVKGIRAACVSDLYSARMCVAHNDANILTLGGKVVEPDMAKEIVYTWLNAKFEGERHQRRVDQIIEFEESN
ncbi:MAG: ribose 5-phosphate isomerase B [Cyanobacteriota bacterium]